MAASEGRTARSVLIERTHLLAEYRDDIVVIGGWVPALLLGRAGEEHVGTLDLDLALDHRALQEPGYQTILKLLLDHGYHPDPRQPFIFGPDVALGERMVTVEVDLLAGEYGGTGRGLNHGFDPGSPPAPFSEFAVGLAGDRPPRRRPYQLLGHTYPRLEQR